MPWLAIAAAVAIGYFFTRSVGSREIQETGWLDTPNPPSDTSMCFPCGPWRYLAIKGQLWYVYLVAGEWGASKKITTKDTDIVLRASSSKDLVAKMEAQEKP